MDTLFTKVYDLGSRDSELYLEGKLTWMDSVDRECACFLRELPRVTDTEWSGILARFEKLYPRPEYSYTVPKEFADRYVNTYWM